MTFNSEQLKMKVKWLLNGKVVFCLEKKLSLMTCFILYITVNK